MIGSCISTHAPYVSFAVLVAMGVYLLLTYHHLLRAIVGLYLMQSATILLFVLLAAQSKATVPILDQTQAPLINPLPHALMLTAIVVGVATLGVGLALLTRIQSESAHLHDEQHEEDV